MSTTALSQEVGWEMLNEQQRAFAKAWVKTHNIRQSMQVAGYDVKTRGYNYERDGRRLLKRCKRYIDYLEHHALRATLVSVEAVQHQLVRFAFANLLNYFTIDEITGKRRPKTLDELGYDEAAALKSWTPMPWTRKLPDGTEQELVVLSDIQLHDSHAALKTLLQSLGGIPRFGNPGDTPPPAPASGGIDIAKLSPQEVRDMDRLFKKALGALSAAADAQAIPVSRGAVEHRHADGFASEARGALSPPASKGPHAS